MKLQAWNSRVIISLIRSPLPLPDTNKQIYETQQMLQKQKIVANLLVLVWLSGVTKLRVHVRVFVHSQC